MHTFFAGLHLVKTVKNIQILQGVFIWCPITLVGLVDKKSDSSFEWYRLNANAHRWAEVRAGSNDIETAIACSNG